MFTRAVMPRSQATHRLRAAIKTFVNAIPVNQTISLAVPTSNSRPSRPPSQAQQRALCCDATCAGYSACGSGMHFKSGRATIAGNTDSACCDTDVTGKCSGNTASSSDVACGTNKQLKSGSASITGNTVAACCDDVCSGFSCPSGYHYKSSYTTIVGNAQAACCDQDITGKCGGDRKSVV